MEDTRRKGKKGEKGENEGRKKGRQRKEKRGTIDFLPERFPPKG